MQKQEQLHGKQNQQCSGLDQLYRQQRHPNRCGPDRAVIHIAVFPGNSVAAAVFCRTGNTIKDRMRASGIVVCCERISCMEALLKGIPFYKMGCKLRQNCSCKQEYRPQPIEIYQIGRFVAFAIGAMAILLRKTSPNSAKKDAFAVRKPWS